MTRLKKSLIQYLLALLLVIGVLACFNPWLPIPNIKKGGVHEQEEIAARELMAEDFFEELELQNNGPEIKFIFVIKFSSHFQPDLLRRMADLVMQIQGEKMFHSVKLILCGPDSSILDPHLQKHFSLQNRSHAHNDILGCIPPAIQVSKEQIVLVLEEEAVLSSNFVKYFQTEILVAANKSWTSLKLTNKSSFTRTSSVLSVTSFGLLCLSNFFIRKFGAKDDHLYLAYFLWIVALLTLFIFFQSFYIHSKSRSVWAYVYKIQPDIETIQENSIYIDGDFFVP